MAWSKSANLQTNANATYREHQRSAARPQPQRANHLNLGRNFRTTQLQAFESLPGGFEPDAVRIAQRSRNISK